MVQLGQSLALLGINDQLSRQCSAQLKYSAQQRSPDHFCLRPKMPPAHMTLSSVRRATSRAKPLRPRLQSSARLTSNQFGLWQKTPDLFTFGKNILGQDDLSRHKR